MIDDIICIMGKIVKNCERCGKEFNPKRPTTKYCSAECRKPPRIIKNCEYCRNEFEYHPINRAKFCSSQCYHIGISLPKVKKIASGATNK